MTINTLKRHIIDDANDFYFEYNGKTCGVEQTVENSIPRYEAWYGDTLTTYDDLDELLHDTFFGGMSIVELLDIVEFEFY